MQSRTLAGDLVAPAMKPIIDPRDGDIEDDASSTKRRSLFALAGSLLAEISLPKLAITWILLIGLPGIMRADSDFIPGEIASYILGGGAAPRATEEESAPGRISAWLVPMRWASVMQGKVATAPDAIRQTLPEYRHFPRLADRCCPSARHARVGCRGMRPESR